MLERMGRPLRGFGNGTANVVGAVFRGLGGPDQAVSSAPNSRKTST